MLCLRQLDCVICEVDRCITLCYCLCLRQLDCVICEVDRCITLCVMFKTVTSDNVIHLLDCVICEVDRCITLCVMFKTGWIVYVLFVR